MTANLNGKFFNEFKLSGIYSFLHKKRYRDSKFVSDDGEESIDTFQFGQLGGYYDPKYTSVNIVRDTPIAKQSKITSALQKDFQIKKISGYFREDIFSKLFYRTDNEIQIRPTKHIKFVLNPASGLHESQIVEDFSWSIQKNIEYTNEQIEDTVVKVMIRLSANLLDYYKHRANDANNPKYLTDCGFAFIGIVVYFYLNRINVKDFLKRTYGKLELMYANSLVTDSNIQLSNIYADNEDARVNFFERMEKQVLVYLKSSSYNLMNISDRLIPKAREIVHEKMYWFIHAVTSRIKSEYKSMIEDVSVSEFDQTVFLYNYYCKGILNVFVENLDTNLNMRKSANPIFQFCGRFTDLMNIGRLISHEHLYDDNNAQYIKTTSPKYTRSALGFTVDQINLNEYAYLKTIKEQQEEEANIESRKRYRAESILMIEEEEEEPEVIFPKDFAIVLMEVDEYVIYENNLLLQIIVNKLEVAINRDPNKFINFFLGFTLEFAKPESQNVIFTLETKMYSATLNNLIQIVIEAVQEITILIMNYNTEQGSGFHLISVINLTIYYISSRLVLAGGCNNLFPTFPNASRIFRKINHHPALDLKCFGACMIYAMERHRQQASGQIENWLSEGSAAVIARKLAEHEKLGQISYPINVAKMSKIETLLQENITIALMEDTKIVPIKNTKKEQERQEKGYKMYPLYTSKNRYKDKPTYKLVLYKNHFLYPYNLERSYFPGYLTCMRCFRSQSREEIYKKHIEQCNDTDALRLEPSKFEFVQFTSQKKRLVNEVVVYADFECIIDKETGRHEPCGVGMYMSTALIKNCRDKFYMYPSKNEFPEKGKAVEKFISKLDEWHSEYALEQYRKYYNRVYVYTTSQCCICLKTDDLKKIQYTSCMSDYFQGNIHIECFQQLDFKFTIVFHNMTNYDLKLFINKLMPGQISAVCKSMFKITHIKLFPYKYISNGQILYGDHYIRDSQLFVTPYYNFIDSYCFLQKSLDDLSSTLKEFTYLEDMDMKKKGTYPYEYMDSFERFQEPQLPAYEKFYSSLKNSNIKIEAYEESCKLFKFKNFKNLRDYHNFYLEADVRLLTEIFQRFRLETLRACLLDPTHYISLPALSWDYMLSFTNIQIGLISKPENFLFVEKGLVRGGLSTLGEKNYSKANHVNMNGEDEFDSTSTWIKYFDVTNLYGYIMTKHLPYELVEDEDISSWVDLNNLQKNLQVILEMKADGDFGYFFEVDLEYPTHLYNSHKGLPLAPIHYNKRLVASFGDKKAYRLHFVTLQCYLKHGLRLLRITNAIRFKQSAWLKPYVELLHSKRVNSTTEFEKLMYKLMINAIFGKTLQNSRKYRDIKIARNHHEASLYARNVKFKGFDIISDDVNTPFVLIHHKKTEMIMDKPIYVGAAITDLAKAEMYNIHYDYFKKNYGDDCQVLYHDTDSLVYEIKLPVNEDLDIDMIKRFGHIFDTSCETYKNLKDYFDPRVFAENNGRIGKLKDETSVPIVEWIGLKSKVYAYRKLGNKEVTKNKGVDYSVQKELTFNIYKQLFDASAGRCKVLLQRPDLDIKELKYTKSMTRILNTKEDYGMKSGQVEKVILSYEDSKLKKNCMLKDGKLVFDKNSNFPLII